MAPQASDPTELLYKGESVLGKPTAVAAPGTLAQPISAGLASVPTAAAPGALTGGPAGAGAPEGLAPAGSGLETSNLLSIIQQALGATEKGAGFASRMADMLKGGAPAGLANAMGSLGPVAPGEQPVPSFNTEFLGNLEGEGVTGPAGSIMPDAAGAGAGAGAAGAGSTAASVGSGLGTAGLGAGAVAAILGAIASATGNADLGKAAQALGATAGAAGTAGAVTSAVAAPAAAGFGTAAGAAAAPIAIALIADQINQLAGGEPIYDFGAMLEPTMGAYPFFGKEVGKTLGEENLALQSFGSALPAVQSQAQLDQLLDLYKNAVGQRVGGYGEGAAPGTVPGLPGATGTAHEWGQVADFDPVTSAINQILGPLRGALPATGGDAGQLWNQMRTQQVDPLQAPMMVTMPDGNVQFLPPDLAASAYGQAVEPLRQAGVWFPEFGSRAIQYGQPGYDYAGAGLLAPGEAPPQSAAWQQLMAGQGAGATAGGSPATPGTPGPPGAAGQQIDEVIRAALARQQ